MSLGVQVVGLSTAVNKEISQGRVITFASGEVLTTSGAPSGKRERKGALPTEQIARYDPHSILFQYLEVFDRAALERGLSS